ncbi:peptidylprolyl isomerase [Acidobacteria bacterium AH-259-A15]|nr:peptidylprolyl isomerase [Acidobacteria bacterium AH-259-A15]
MRSSNRLTGVNAAVIFALLAGIVPPLFAQEIVILDEIVAKVNQEIITLSDIKKELLSLKSGLRREIQNPQALEREFQERKRTLLRNMIQNKILLQRGEELGVSANIDVDVAATLEQMRKGSGIPNLEVLDQYLRQQGSSLEQYRRSLKEKMIVDSLVQQFVYSKITLLTPEIEAYYQANIDRFTEAAEVELKEILFLTEGKDKVQVRKKAEEVLGKLQSGASFEDLAKQYSEGPTASRAGDIGSFKKGSMAEPIEEAAFQLEEGQFSGIIETEYGLQIIKVMSKKAARQKPLEEIRPQIVRELYQKKAEPGLKEFFESLREQSYIYVAAKYREEYDVEGL